MTIAVIALMLVVAVLAPFAGVDTRTPELLAER
jgi:hypothetical protein